MRTAFALVSAGLSFEIHRKLKHSAEFFKLNSPFFSFPHIIFFQNSKCTVRVIRPQLLHILWFHSSSRSHERSGDISGVCLVYGHFLWTVPYFFMWADKNFVHLIKTRLCNCTHADSVWDRDWLQFRRPMYTISKAPLKRLNEWPRTDEMNK